MIAFDGPSVACGRVRPQNVAAATVGFRAATAATERGEMRVRKRKTAGYKRKTKTLTSLFCGGGGGGSGGGYGKGEV